MNASRWSTQQLAEFVAAVSAAETEAVAARVSVERAAEELDADVAAIVCGGEVFAAVGYPEGSAPVDQLEAVGAGVAGSRLDIPGVGPCAAAAATLEHPPGARLVIARPDTLTREEYGLLRAMARVASMTLRMLRVLDDERGARDELAELARGQEALRRVATLVAEAASPDEVFAAVAQEVGGVVPAADVAFVARYEPEGAIEFVGGWSRHGDASFVGSRVSLGGRNVATRVLERNAPARVDHLIDDATPATALARNWARSAVGAPINVEGRLWGVMIVGSRHEGGLEAGVEHRLAEFTELVATAIANAEAQAELAASRARIIATADETRRRIERDLHDGAQQRLVTLALQLRAVQAAVPPGLEELAEELDSVATGLTNALDELREYARGIHPAMLAEGGLRPALGALARRSTLPVDLDVRADEPLPERIELGAYYVVSEALTNAAKHANASSVAVSVEAAEGVLNLSIRDDGVGGAVFAHGSGLFGLKDRVEALGGRLSLESAPGEGTSIHAELPIDDTARSR
jgi:signal transduction histidine kinase